MVDTERTPANVLLELQPSGSRKDPALEIRGMPPNYGNMAVPHVATFQGIAASVARVYRTYDEAMKHSADNARFMLNDTTLSECIEQRQRSVALLNWHLEVDNPRDPRQKKLAENLTKIVEQIPYFLKLRESLLEAVWLGKSAVQWKWGMQRIYGCEPAKGLNSNFAITEWLPVHGDKLVFRFDDGSRRWDPHQVGIRVGAGYAVGDAIKDRQTRYGTVRKIEATDYGLAYFLEPYEMQNLCIHKHMIRDGYFEDSQSAGQIHGVGVRSRVYWTWYQKQECLSFLIEFLERSALGLEIWYYPWGNAEAEAKTRQAAENRIGQGRNIILMPRPIDESGSSPYGVEKLEPGMAGAEALRAIIQEYFGALIKRYILGQTLTTEAASTGLGSNLASIHMDTYLQIVRYDAINLQETLTRCLIDLLKLRNYPDLREIPVRFKIDTESHDAESKLKAFRDAYDMGLKIPAADVYAMIGASKPEADEESLESPEVQRAKQELQQQAQQAQQAAMMAAMGGQQAASQPGQQPPDGQPADGEPQQQEPQQPQESAAEPETAPRQYSLRDDITAAAARTDTAPTEAAKQAGNYAKGKVRIQGLEISIENPAGSIRSGTDRDGKPWSVELQNHYGYIRRTESAADGDHVDVFLGPHPESEIVFVIDQTKRPTWTVFDEHKVMLGFTAAEKAKAAYLANFSPGWRGFSGITAMTMDQFKAWLKEGNTGRRIEPQVTVKYSLADAVDFVVDQCDIPGISPEEIYQLAERLIEEPQRYSSQFDPEKHPHDADGRWAKKPGKRITRTQWGKQHDRCHLCGSAGSETMPLHTHEICRGPHRAAAMKEPCAWLRTCVDCHDAKLDGMSIVRQLAIKKLRDPEHYDRQTVNVLRSRQPDAITEEEVDAEAEKIDDDPQKYSLSHDVSREPRESNGRWTAGDSVHAAQDKGGEFGSHESSSKDTAAHNNGSLNEGDTKMVNGRNYVVREGHWHRDRDNDAPEHKPIEITGKEFGVNWNDNGARKAMLPRLLEQFSDDSPYTNHDTQMPIKVSQRGFKKILSHLPDAKPAMVLAKLPEILEGMAWTHDDDPDPPDENIKKWHYFHADVVLAGALHDVEIKVREDSNGRWFYDQHVKVS